MSRIEFNFMMVGIMGILYGIDQQWVFLLAGGLFLIGAFYPRRVR